MLRIYVVERSAQSRNSIAQRIHDWMQENISQSQYLPHIQLRNLSPEEVTFLAEPDILIVGPELLFQSPLLYQEVKQRYAQSPCLAWIPEEKDDLSLCEQLARQGCVDIFHHNSDPQHFLRRILVLVRAQSTRKSGKIVLVDSGKGGVGVTSVTAALGEMLANEGRSTILIDTDTESQSLSRFLQVRPFLNENLQVLLEQLRPVGEEMVEQCLQSVWGSGRALFCLAPPADGDLYCTPTQANMRSFLNVLEVLDEKFDYILIDMAGLRGHFQQTLYRAADFSFFLLSPDPSSFFACLDKYNCCRAFLGPQAKSQVLVNDSAAWAGLPLAVLRREFLAHTGLGEDSWCSVALAYERQASRWPGSGQTLASRGSAGLYRSFRYLLAGMGEGMEEPSRAARFFQKFTKEKSEVAKQGRSQERSPILEPSFQRPRISLTPALEMLGASSARLREGVG